MDNRLRERERENQGKTNVTGWNGEGLDMANDERRGLERCQ